MRFRRRCVARALLIFAVAVLSSYCAGQAPPQPAAKPVAVFPPLEQWKAAVIRGNVAALQALYSSNPPAQVATAAGASTVTSEVAFSTSKVIYAPGVDAHAEIKHALQLAAKGHKRVLVVFGANWCYDCHVLDLAFLRTDIAGVLQQNFEVVHVDVGEGDKNQDLMAEYQVPMKRGIPAIAVLDSNGNLLYSQKGGEFEKARALAPEDVLRFLNKWKPVTR